MFDLGMAELLIIGTVALIVVGPKDLPGLFRSVGQFVGKAKAMARDFQRAMDQAADDAGVKDIKDMGASLKKATDPKAMGMDALKDATTGWSKSSNLDGKELGPETAKLSEERAEAAKKIRDAAAAKATARKEAEAAAAAGDVAEAPVAKPSAAKKPAAKKAPAKKAPAKKAPAKKAAAAKAATPAKKTTAKKPAAKKAPAKKAAAAASSEDSTQ